MGLSDEKITIRPLATNDLQIFKDLRLKALQLHPGNFSARLEKLLREPDTFWQDILDGNGKQIFGLFANDRLIGLTSVFDEGHHQGRHLGSLHMSFIEPEYRGAGLSRLFYEARIDWAKRQGIQSLYVSHRHGNDASRKAIERFGFVLDRQEEIDWPDGLRAMDYIYRLDL